MMQHNAGLTASHPYASSPINWPFLLSGISFWTENSTNKQIYLIGNIVGWWTCVVSLSVYVGVLGADLLARRRGIEPITNGMCPERRVYGRILMTDLTAVRNRLWNSAGFFMLVWMVHYLPFFVMNRQLFIHHYLPSHLASALIAGAVLNFIFSESVNFPVSIRGPKTRPRPHTWSDLGLKGPITVAAYSVALIAMFVYMAPLTYGTPGWVVLTTMSVATVVHSRCHRLDGDAVNRHRLLSSWTLHFAAKKMGDGV